MAKWANYLVSAVHYTDNTKKYISQLREHNNDGNSVGTGRICTKENVIKNIEAGYSYCTIMKNNEGNWSKGEEIMVFKRKYLKTKPNNIEEDNLGNLPEF